MNQLKEGEDYYINEEGLFVFTEKYHLKRGYCCNSGCRHCPYGTKHDSHSTKHDSRNTKHDNRKENGEVRR